MSRCHRSARRAIVIEDPAAGRRRRALSAPRRCVGDRSRSPRRSSATATRRCARVVRYRRPASAAGATVPMARADAAARRRPLGGAFEVDALGRWQWQIEAFTDRFATWRDELQRKLAAGETELELELAEGVAILARPRARARGADRAPDRDGAAERSRDPAARSQERCRAALEPALARPSRARPDRSDAAHGPVVEIDVERVRARVGAWYELFPRSWGGFAGRRARAAAVRGARHRRRSTSRRSTRSARTARKGRNDAPAAPGPATPAARGRSAAPRAATPPIHPDLGTIEDFDRARRRGARRTGIEIALDFAIQCSADHPWLTRAPGVVPPPPRRHAQVRREPAEAVPRHLHVDFDCEDWRGLWRALRDVVLYWVAHGVRDLPRRQPAHQAARVLGVADRVGAAQSTPTSSSSARRSRASR